MSAAPDHQPHLTYQPAPAAAAPPSPPGEPPGDYQPRCSFCLAPRGLVKGLVASDDTGVMICDECLDFAAQLMRGHLRSRRRSWWRWW